MILPYISFFDKRKTNCMAHYTNLPVIAAATCTSTVSVCTEGCLVGTIRIECYCYNLTDDEVTSCESMTLCTAESYISPENAL